MCRLLHLYREVMARLVQVSNFSAFFVRCRIVQIRAIPDPRLMFSK